MACNAEILKSVQLFSLLDDEELAVLAGQVEFRTFSSRQRIYKIGDPSERAVILVSGAVRITTIDEDNQVVLLDTPAHGDVFGFASMLAQTPHQTNATADEDTTCIELDRNDITILLRRKPDAGLDLMSVLGKQFHATERLVRLRAARNPNAVIEEAETLGENIADTVASFGGSWTFIILFAVILAVYTLVNVELGHRAWDPYPFILLNLGCAGRVSLQILTDFIPRVAYPLVGLTGFLEFAALAWWGAELWRVMNISRTRHVAPVFIQPPAVVS